MPSKPSFARLIRGKKHIAAVVPHTHWDRAWYHPFEQFRLSLCRKVLRVMELVEGDGRFRWFNFDGQSVVIEDFLELHPDQRGRVERLVRAGRLNFGPLYVLPDFFLITGESHIRNGMIGQDLAESFGRSSRQGYVADPFGLISQTPQIWEGLGLESIFFSRGMSKADLRKVGPTFWWVGPDGHSRVLGVAQVGGGYSNLVCWGVPLGTFPRPEPDTDRIDFAHSEKQVRDVRASYLGGVVTEFVTTDPPRGRKLRGHGTMRSRVLFFGNGCDHHGPQHMLGDLVDHNRKAFADLAFAVVSTDEFVDLVRQEKPRLGSATGEMHHDGLWPTLNGTLDSRPYLKQQYDEAAGWIERRAEPLCALADRLRLPARAFREQHQIGFAFNAGNNMGLAAPYPAEAIDGAWKTLLKNAPHDDICGCSIDATHADAEDRTKRVVEMASMLATDGIVAIGQHIRGADILSARTAGVSPARILAFNPLGFARACPIRVKATIPANSAELVLTDEAGQPVEAAIRARVTGEHFRRWHSEVFEELPAKEVEVEVFATVELPACGYRTLLLCDNPGGTLKRTLFRLGVAMADDHPQAEKSPLEGATQHTGIRRLPSGMENAFVRVAVRTDGTVDILDKSTGTKYRGLNRLRDRGDAGGSYVSRLLDDGIVTALPSHGRMKCVLDLPDRVAFEVRLRIPRVPAGISERRKARSKDTLPLEIAFTYTLYAHDAALHVRAEWTNRHRDHRLTVEFPTPFATRRTDAGSTFDLVPHKAPFLQASCRNFVTAAEGGSRLTILSRAMHSYDTAHEGRLTLAKCLLKATSCVNPDLLPWWPAPEGNCLRPIVQEYAILPGRARDKWHALQAAADGLVCPPLIEYFTSAGPQPQGVLPASASFLDVPAPLHLSAFKRCRHRPSLLVRVYNASTHAARARLAVSPLLRVRKAYRTDLREKCQGPLKFDGRHVEVPCRPKEIVSIELA